MVLLFGELTESLKKRDIKYQNGPAQEGLIYLEIYSLAFHFISMVVFQLVHAVKGKHDLSKEKKKKKKQITGETSII